MPRRARMYRPGLPYHVFQRGNNRSACFFDADDREFYLSLLAQTSKLYGVDLHAYVLMTNHIHLLLTPASEDSISRMTRVAGSRYAQRLNKKYRRTGSLWEGRHKSCPVETATYLLKCYVYIELNPVRAKMVSCPNEYHWSSYTANALGIHSNLVTPHSAYRALGASTEDRCRVYRDIVGQAFDEQALQAIRCATHYCSPLGSEDFREKLEGELGTSLGQQARGRPRKQEARLIEK